MKLCKKCNQPKTWMANWAIPQWACHPCKNKWGREYYGSHPEQKAKKNARTLVWRIANPEKSKLSVERWRKANRDDSRRINRRASRSYSNVAKSIQQLSQLNKLGDIICKQNG